MHDYPVLYYTRVLNVCAYSQTYSLACPWLLSCPDFLRGGMHRGDNLGTYAVDVCSLAKIGVILVSCSCGKRSPIDADVSNRFCPQLLETKCCTPRPQWSCTTYFVLCLEFLYQVGASSANNNPGAGEHKGRFFLGNFYPKKKSGHDRLGIRARLTIG